MTSKKKSPAKKATPKKKVAKKVATTKKRATPKKAATKKAAAPKKAVTAKKKVTPKKAAVKKPTPKKSSLVKKKIISKITASQPKTIVQKEIKSVSKDSTTSLKQKDTIRKNIAEHIQVNEPAIVEQLSLPMPETKEIEPKKGFYKKVKGLATDRNHDPHHINLNKVKKGGPKPSGKKPLW